MLPLLGIIAVLFIGVSSAGAVAGKIYNKRRWKKMKMHSKLKKRNRSPGDEIEEDLGLGRQHESVDIDNDKSEISVAAAAAAEEMEVDSVAELMKVHNVSGPARFLFTIEELSRLEDESKKVKKEKKTRKCFIDLMGELDGSKFPTTIGCPVIKSTRSLTGSVFEDGNGLVNDMFDRSNFKSLRETTSFGKMQGLVVAARG